MNLELGTTTRILLYALSLLLGVLVLTRTRSRTARQCFLLAVSYALYLTWGPWFLLVLLASTAMNFVLGRQMQRKPSAGILWTGLFFNLLLLGVFKYLPGARLPFLSRRCKSSRTSRCRWAFPSGPSRR